MNRSLLGHWEARPRATRHLYGLHFHPTWQLAHFKRENEGFSLSLAFYFSVLRWLSFSFKNFSFHFTSHTLLFILCYHTFIFSISGGKCHISRAKKEGSVSIRPSHGYTLFPNASRYLIFCIAWLLSNILVRLWLKITPNLS